MLKEKIKNPRWPHHILIERKEYGDIFAEEEDSNEEGTEKNPADGMSRVLYDGKGRSYTDTTTTGGGAGESRVDVNKRKASIPVRFDEWEEAVLDGDSITVTIGNITESGTVRDFEPDNNRTVIYWDLTRN